MVFIWLEKRSIMDNVTLPILIGNTLLEAISRNFVGRKLTNLNAKERTIYKLLKNTDWLTEENGMITLHEYTEGYKVRHLANHKIFSDVNFNTFEEAQKWLSEQLSGLLSNYQKWEFEIIGKDKS